MKKARTHPPETVALIVVVLAIAAGVISFTACGGAPAVDAQAIVENACSQSDDMVSFDMSSTWELPVENQKFVYTTRVSGDDFHIISTIESGGQVMSGEIIGVDNLLYAREEGEEWVYDKYLSERGFTSWHNFHKLHPTSSDSKICPDLGEVTRVGEDMVDSKPTIHFQGTDSMLGFGPVANVDAGDSPQDDLTIHETWNVWVDSNNQIVKTRVVVEYPPTGEETQAAFGELISVISGVGEPNVITAPVIP